MTLEQRLVRRLRNWRDAARQHRDAMDDYDELSPDRSEQNEWLMHKVEAEAFERCMSEVVADLSADLPASTAARLARSVHSNRDNLTV